MKNQSIWQNYKIQKDGLFFSNIGDLKMWCRFMQGEIQIAYEHDPGNGKSAAPQNPPDDILWSRWPLKVNNRIIQLVPLLPDRAVVIKPESPFRIIKSEQVQVYTRVPIWVQMNVINNEVLHLTDIPSTVLSNTWFGSVLEGELCYWISSGLRQSIEIDPRRPHMAICPILLINHSEEELLIERIYLHVDNLSLYISNRQLWSDETQIEYKGKEQISHISVSGKAPAESVSAVLITPPRNPVKKSFVAKTFSTLKDLPGLGID